MTIYKSTGVSLIATVLFLYFYMSAKKNAIRIWCEKFKIDSQFRRVLIFVFYVMMILFRTLLNRQIWINPLSNVLGGWGMYDSNGEFTGETIENLILFIPFTFLLLSYFSKKMSDGVNLFTTVKYSIFISFIFSISIEFS